MGVSLRLSHVSVIHIISKLRSVNNSIIRLALFLIEQTLSVAALILDKCGVVVVVVVNVNVNVNSLLYTALMFYKHS